MYNIKVAGDKNITNTGDINGSYNINSPVIVNFINILNMDNEKSLANMIEAQKKLAIAIDKFAEVELIRAEADKLRAKADENNSIANLNYSKIMLEDREIIKQLMEKLK